MVSIEMDVVLFPSSPIGTLGESLGRFSVVHNSNTQSDDDEHDPKSFKVVS